jgi:hypothetical protein
VNHPGEIISLWLTLGNVADNNKNIVVKMCANLFGKLFVDKRYISKELFAELFEKGIELLKSACYIEHFRHRSPVNAIINICEHYYCLSIFRKKTNCIYVENNLPFKINTRTQDINMFNSGLI